MAEPNETAAPAGTNGGADSQRLTDIVNGQAGKLPGVSLLPGNGSATDGKTDDKKEPARKWHPGGRGRAPDGYKKDGPKLVWTETHAGAVARIPFCAMAFIYKYRGWNLTEEEAKELNPAVLEVLKEYFPDFAKWGSIGVLAGTISMIFAVKYMQMEADRAAAQK